MSAITTAERVVQWAIDAKFKVNEFSAPPQGDAGALEGLIRPPEDICRMLEQLVALTIAQLPLGTPPLGDPRSTGADALIIATSLGLCSTPNMALILLDAVGTTRSMTELVARHGLIQPALPFLSPELAEEFKLISPLTAILSHPVGGTEQQLVMLVERFLNHKTERQTLVLHFAKPTDNLFIRDWRLYVLDIFRLGDENQKKFVLDVYEAQMIYHEQEMLDQMRNATHVILNPSAYPDISGGPETTIPNSQLYRFREDSPVRNALSVGQWWGPLFAIDRTQREALRERRYLGYDYRRGIDLYNFCNKYKNRLNHG